MGVKRTLTLTTAKLLFPSYDFKSLTPSITGVIDTTYISDKYILKFYERDIEEKISSDANILKSLHKIGLNVPQLLASSQGWYLYEKLQGESPLNIKYFHIQSLARFMATFHSLKLQKHENFLQQFNIKQNLTQIKRSHYRFYKELEVLKYYKMKNDGFIHGDLFKDNSIFNKDKIGVIDFIDGGGGTYVFDIAVCLLSFNTSKRDSYIRLFLNTYNQMAPKKIDKKELLQNIKTASLLYAMLRLYKEKNLLRTKKLIFR